MTSTIRRKSRHLAPRRGVTLVEMLVTVAVLVIIMTVLVQIFQSATGALTAAQQIQDLDNQIKLLESTIRSDLGGATAHFTPPLDPTQNLGYFEYIENEFADTQGEDSDDCLRFTAQAPPGQPFTGRVWVTQPANAQFFSNSNAQPVTVTSEYAEIIYFLRNGNLYRRVLLIAPELQPAIVPTVGNLAFTPSLAPNAGGIGFYPTALGNTVVQANGAAFIAGAGAVPVSWQGVNDLSAHPATTGPNHLGITPSSLAAHTIVLNTLSSLTNRENRFAAPRFSDDYFTLTVNPQSGAVAVGPNPDGFSDDLNGDKVPDLYPTLYPNVLATGLINAPNYLSNYSINTGPFTIGSGLLAFPYIFPGAYTQPQILSADQYGWIHSPSPYANVVPPFGNDAAQTFEQNPIGYLQCLNHNPLDLADNLPTPSNPPITQGNISGTQMLQTWWGFPTWRETLSVHWNDPTKQVNDANGIGVNAAAYGQPNGLTPRAQSVVPVAEDNQLLPWMGVPLTTAQGGTFPAAYDFSIIRRNPEIFSDAQAYHNNMSIFLGVPGGPIDPIWAVSFEDDLVMTNVRSFDVKAYDNVLGNYADLGWGNDVRFAANVMTPAAAGSFLHGNADFSGNNVVPPLVGIQGSAVDYINNTFAHEGRMPPITNDLRFDAQFGIAANYLGAGSPFLTVNMGTYNNGNIGDDSPGVVRLRRVWDSWSTAYSQAPAHGLNNSTGFLVGPPYSPPVYPSYPAPYPAALRGIQIQIRVADPTNQRVKSLTIRQDFTNQL